MVSRDIAAVMVRAWGDHRMGTDTDAWLGHYRPIFRIISALRSDALDEEVRASLSALFRSTVPRISAIQLERFVEDSFTLYSRLCVESV